MTTSNKILVGVATYNESLNIEKLIVSIFNLKIKNLDLLIVDDNSPDGTSEITSNLINNYNNLKLITRCNKLGIGSAHKDIINYAKSNNYLGLVTMDADFSHPPALINKFLEMNNNEDFIIASRYANGGGTDNKGYRKYISIFGNNFAKYLLNMPANDLTNSYRFFPKKVLDRMDMNLIDSNGYSFFVEVMYLVHKKNIKIIEIPFHFFERTKNISKIPKNQFFLSLVTLFKIKFSNLKKK